MGLKDSASRKWEVQQLLGGYDVRRDPWVLGLMLVSSMERRKIVEGIGRWVGLEAWLGSLSFGWTAVLLGVAHIAFCPDRDLIHSFV